MNTYRASVGMVRVLSSAVGIALVLCACGKKNDDAPAAPSPASASASPCAPGLDQAASSPIVTIDGKALTCAELYQRDREVIDAMTAKYDEKVLEVHTVALSELIDDRLLQDAADEAKLTVEGLVANSISAVPPTDEDAKNFYDQAVASGEKLAAFEETKVDIVKFLTERRQKASLSAFRAGLRAKATIEIHAPNLKAVAPAPAPAAAPAPAPAPAPAAAP